MDDSFVKKTQTLWMLILQNNPRTLTRSIRTLLTPILWKPSKLWQNQKDPWTLTKSTRTLLMTIFGNPSKYWWNQSALHEHQIHRKLVYRWRVESSRTFTHCIYHSIDTYDDCHTYKLSCYGWTIHRHISTVHVSHTPSIPERPQLQSLNFVPKRLFLKKIIISRGTH